jgi:hypothetical protein
VEGRDDEELWRTDPLVQALRAPGSPAELAREAEFVAAFRTAQPRGSVRRLVGRVGIAATATMTTVVLTAGVAAAYGRVLPAPVQRLAHSVLGPVGVQAPHPAHHPKRSTVKTAAPKNDQTTTVPPRSGASPVTKPPSATSSSTPAATTTPSPTGTPSGTAGAPIPDPGSPTSTPTDSTTPTRRVSAAVSIDASSNQVVVGSAVTISGVVTDADGRVLRHRTVRLQAHAHGEPWATVIKGVTARDGSVELTSADLDRTTVFRLRTAHGVHSVLAHVLVQPSVSASVTSSGGASSFAVTVIGGQPGDRVKIYERRSGTFVVVATGTLGADGSTVVTTPTPKRRTSVLVRVSATVDHAAAGTHVALDNG